MNFGQRYLKRGYYIKAVEQFNRIRNNYRDDPLAIEAELAIADVHFKKGEWDIARTSYDAFRRRYPRHDRIDYVVYQIGLTFYKKAPRFAGRDQTWTTQAINSWTRFEDKYTTSEYGVEVLELREECLERLAKSCALQNFMSAERPGFRFGGAQKVSFRISKVAVQIRSPVLAVVVSDPYSRT